MLSVIIPVYNGEKWLNRCLDSLRRQTVFSDMEIVIVDDGSKDGSGAIIDRFAAENGNVQAIHIRNQGVSNARNVGIAASRGEYVTFIDVDDYVDEDCYERMLAAAKPDVDIVCNGYIAEYSSNSVERKSSQTREYKGAEAVKSFLLAEYISPNVWDKLFRREVLAGQKFKTDLTLGEDKCFVFDCICHARSVVVCPFAGYHYVMNEESVVHTNYSEKKMRNVLHASAYIRETANREYPQFSVVVESQYVDTQCRVYTEMYSSGMHKEFPEIYAGLKRDIRRFSLLKKLKTSSKKHTLALLAAKISPAFYLFLKHDLKLQYK